MVNPTARMNMNNDKRNGDSEWEEASPDGARDPERARLAASRTAASPMTQGDLAMVFDGEGRLTICPAGDTLFGHNNARRLGHALEYAMRHATGGASSGSLTLVAQTDVRGNVEVVCHCGAASQARYRCAPDVIVHDLKSPLGTIMLEAALLDESSGLDAERARTVAHRIRRNVEYLCTLVDDVLDFGALERGELLLRCTATDLRVLLQDLIERAVSTRDHDRVSLLAPGPVVLELDCKRIERVAANLLDNALKYSPRTSPIVVRLQCNDDHVRVSIADTGPGIDDTDQCTIFDKYCRGENARGAAGSGIGLYVSKQIVEAHGGRIGVDSVRGRGACFYFDLPLA
jgi:nitrogen-specific signal transduction histidine kinase